jgi:hypothetical protein
MVVEGTYALLAEVLPCKGEGFGRVDSGAIGVGTRKPLSLRAIRGFRSGVFASIQEDGCSGDWEHSIWKSSLISMSISSDESIPPMVEAEESSMAPGID